MRAAASRLLHAGALLALLLALLPWLGLGAGPFRAPGMSGELPRLQLLGGDIPLYDELTAVLRWLPAAGGSLREAPAETTEDAAPPADGGRVQPFALVLVFLPLALLLGLGARLLRPRRGRQPAPAVPEAEDEEPPPSVPATSSGPLKRGIGTALRTRLQVQAVSLEAEAPSIRADFYRETSDSEAPVLIAKFSGTYRHGSAGDPDARCMIGLTRAAISQWEPAAVIIDLSDLSYVWGQALEDLFHTGEDEVEAVAVVLGPLCRPAVETLVNGEDDEPLGPGQGFFDSVDRAWLQLRR